MFIESVLYRMSKHINIDNEIRLFKDNIESLRITNIFKNRRINIITALIYYTTIIYIYVNDTLRMYKNDDIRMYNFNCITDTIVEVITTCNTYTLLTVHLL